MFSSRVVCVKSHINEKKMYIKKHETFMLYILKALKKKIYLCVNTRLLVVSFGFFLVRKKIIKKIAFLYRKIRQPFLVQKSRVV